jgi:uncharacterized membrane protein YjjP (DUF1212 family)
MVQTTREHETVMSGAAKSADDEHSLVNTPPPSLNALTMVVLDAARLLMESGGKAKTVDDFVHMLAHGLGAESAELRIGYASMALTVSIGHSSITRMKKVGPIGVNQRLEQGLWQLARRGLDESLIVEGVEDELLRLAATTPRYHPWVTAVGVGLACAAFGRLLGVDWRGSVPVFFAATVGQCIRQLALKCRLNVFICTVLVSSISSLLASVGGRWAGSRTIGTAVIASVLLLVPGVPAVNALNDILQGYPTLGSARAITVMMTLIFITAGLWIGPAVLNLGR